MKEREITIAEKPYKVYVSDIDGKDGWDRFSIIGSILGSILIPFMVLFVGNLLSEQQEKSSQIARQAQQLGMLIDHLSSENPRERKIAMDIANFLAKNDQIPKELIPALIDSVVTDESAIVAKAASEVLAEVEKQDAKLKEQIQQGVVGLPPRIYFHIIHESQRKSAEKLAAELTTKLSSIRLSVPGVTKRHGPAISQLRFFKQEEKAEAGQIAEVIKKIGVDVELIDLSKQYQNSTHIRPRHYELWLGGDFIFN